MLSVYLLETTQLSLNKLMLLHREEKLIFPTMYDSPIPCFEKKKGESRLSANRTILLLFISFGRLFSALHLILIQKGI